MHRGGAENPTRLEDRAREIGVIHRVWKMLCFQAERAAVRIFFAAFSRLFLQEIAAVKLNARLVGVNLHHPTAIWILYSGGEPLFAGLAAHDIVVVVPLPRRVIGRDAFANLVGGAEIQERAGHWLNFSGWNQSVIRRRKLI